jgi:hypothetical protein
MAQTVGYYYKGERCRTEWIVVTCCCIYKHHLVPSLISCRKSDSIRPREQNTQVNDKSNIQEVASGGDEGCGSATSLVMTIAATIIGQYPPDHNMSDAYRPSGWAAL